MQEHLETRALILAEILNKVVVDLKKVIGEIEDASMVKRPEDRERGDGRD